MKTKKDWAKEKEFYCIRNGFVDLDLLKELENWIEKIQKDAYDQGVADSNYAI